MDCTKLQQTYNNSYQNHNNVYKPRNNTFHRQNQFQLEIDLLGSLKVYNSPAVYPPTQYFIDSGELLCCCIFVVHHFSPEWLGLITLF